MKLRTKQEQIATVAARWNESYKIQPSENATGIYERLSALPQNATEAQVSAIVGASSWVMTYWIRNACAVCGQDVPVTVELAPECPECGTMLICPDCLRKALALCQD